MKTGTVVMSLAGHDSGQLYVVAGHEGTSLLLCDGKSKLLYKPKKKNVRHLKKTGMYVELSNYSPLYDAHIRKELKCLSKCVDSNTLLTKKGGCSLG